MQASKNVEYEDKIAQLESASEELARKLQVAQESESTASGNTPSDILTL